MRHRNNPIQKIRRAAAVAMLTVGLGVGLAISPAAAAPNQSGANLRITPAGSGQYRVEIWGVYPMSAYDAHGYINNLATGRMMELTGQPGGMAYHIWGDDSGSNDGARWYNFYPGAGSTLDGQLYATDSGIGYYRSFTVPSSTLNEDDSVFDRTDEIYVDANLIDGDMGSHRAYSNVVVGRF
jgi:hypothetical protein